MNKSIYENIARLAVNKSLLKEYSNSSRDRIVYMNDGTEFQIQIFNPYSYTVGVSFAFNEKNGSYSSWNEQLLVIKPGQRVWLERYLNDEAKLLFSTYEVGNSKAAKEAIKANGLVTIKFYKEKEQVKFMPYITTRWDGKYYDGNNYINNYINYCDASLSLDSVKLTSDAVTNAPTTTFYNSSCATTATTLGCDVKGIDKGIDTFKLRSKSIETGRIDKGSHSNQKFNTINIDFESYPFSTETIQILPSSQKPVTSNDLNKVYCSNCGRKLNAKFKFCPYCGAKVDFCPNNDNQNRGYVIEKCPNCGRNVRSNMMQCPHCGEILR